MNITLQEWQLLRFKDPTDADEAREGFIVIEDRDTRVLVGEVRLANWALRQLRNSVTLYVFVSC
jgi:hypothetical protein